jgi:hypothetical protein
MLKGAEKLKQLKKWKEFVVAAVRPTFARLSSLNGKAPRLASPKCFLKKQEFMVSQYGVSVLEFGSFSGFLTSFVAEHSQKNATYSIIYLKNKVVIDLWREPRKNLCH